MDDFERTAYDKVLSLNESGTPIESSGSWQSLIKGLGFSDKKEFSLFIKDKVVIDVGSGMGGLFKEAKIRNVYSKVININPRFAIAGFSKLAHEKYEELSREVPSNIREINSLHDKSSLAAFSNKLPIKDSSVDIVIDHKGAVYHCLYEDNFDMGILETNFKPNIKVLEETIDEYLRVLNDTGKVRIGGLLEFPSEGINLFLDTLNDKNIQFTEIKDEKDVVIGVEIKKS